MVKLYYVTHSMQEVSRFYSFHAFVSHPHSFSGFKSFKNIFIYTFLRLRLLLISRIVLLSPECIELPLFSDKLRE